MVNDSIKAMAEFTDTLDCFPNEAYDFICNNYHRFDKSELANIIKELIYSTHYHTVHNFDEGVYRAILGDVAIELDEQYNEAYQECEKEEH